MHQGDVAGPSLQELALLFLKLGAIGFGGRSATAGAFLDGVNAASLALMFVITYQLGRAAVIDVSTIILAIPSAIALFRFHVNSGWLILGGAVAGLLLSATGRLQEPQKDML